MFEEKGSCSKFAADTLFGTTGDDNTGMLMKHLCASCPDKPLLCHGYPTLTAGQFTGKQYFHAWVEIGQIVIDCGSLEHTPIVVPAVVYYRVGQIDPDWVSSFTKEQAVEYMDRFRTYGPWIKILPTAVG